MPPVPAGTATPWRLIDDSPEIAIYARTGDKPGPSELLAEQLRIDSFAPSIGPAMRLADETTPRRGWLGVDEDNDYEVSLCSRDGWTPDGRLLLNVQSCVIAEVNLED